MSFDLVFECDYGNRKPVKTLLVEIVDDYDADIMPMVAAFVNNNPYTLELYVALSFESEFINLKENIISKFKTIGATRRTDVTFMDLMVAHGRRQFNSSTFIDGKTVEVFFESNMFFFPERKELHDLMYGTEYMKPESQMFVSYSSPNEDDVDEFVSKLNERNIAVWFAKNSIDYGESIMQAIQEATDTCIGVLFYITKDFIQSNWCKLEMETFLDKYASARNVLIITIKGKDVERKDLPPFLRNLKYLDMNNFDCFDSIVDEISPTIHKFQRKNDA